MSVGRIAAILFLSIIALYLAVISYQFIQIYPTMTHANRTYALWVSIVGWSIVVLGVVALLVTRKHRR